ncbi:aldolase [Aspergillus japonicus CBS 114.51]|uniref:Aldolase n=1 Tax=Aspergillus japonicus CBS 114.51 TaxID=1448312 RepID=A0A8T8WUU4_ASPJA|nr:aldolase [Aspergillus japonicus CBS 114.51]RAH79618.1 aldolase [Aspergillus japonicus CBS 114.51]
MAPRKPNFGVYTPLVTFFAKDESLDLASTLTHAKRMAEGGVAGLVLQGSNGEAPHLDHSDRKSLVRAVRDHLNELGYAQMQLIVGCGAPSVRETLVHITEAEESGADFALILPPSYWVAAMTPAVIEGFFNDVACSSPLPMLIYNFPGVTGGIDISSDSIIRLAQSNSNIVGCKLTCGNVGKLQRISSTLPTDSFAAFGGKSDFFLPALVAGSNGIIAALANIAPKVHVEVLRRYQDGDIRGAQELQSCLSHADDALVKVGVTGVKAIVSHHFGYGSGQGRKPLESRTVDTFSANVLDPIQRVVDLEKMCK